MERRTFLKGLFAVAASAKTASIAIVEKVALRPARAVMNWTYGNLRNSGAWNPRYKCYDQAKEESDKIAKKILERGFNG